MMGFAKGRFATWRAVRHGLTAAAAIVLAVVLAAGVVAQGPAAVAAADPLVPSPADTTLAGVVDAGDDPANAANGSGALQPMPVERDADDASAEAAPTDGADGQGSNAADAGGEPQEGDQPSEATSGLITSDAKAVPLSSDNLVNPQQMPDSSFIYDTTIADLDGAETYLDNQIVQVVGEVVGDRINAEFEDGFCWIALQEQGASNAVVSVFLTKDATEAIDAYGRYGQVGTILQVRGMFHLSCPQHNGLTDLHADNVSVINRGVTVRQGFDLTKFIPGLALVFIGLVAAIVYRRMREGQR